jgi:tetratricopeptide (TPR) repeat protein
LEYDYLNKEAAAVRNEAYFQMGLRLVRQNKYEAAMKMFGKVDEDHAGLTIALQDAHKQELQRAEALLQAKAYTNALTVARLVLEYDPSNAKAGELVNRIVCDHGNALVEEQKYEEAMAVLAQGDERSYCISETKAAIQTHLKQQAETHYLLGVKYFLLEDLQQAINEWEIAVKLDPEHDKARSGIQNARHLLEQLDKVE